MYLCRTAWHTEFVNNFFLLQFAHFSSSFFLYLPMCCLSGTICSIAITAFICVLMLCMTISSYRWKSQCSKANVLFPMALHNITTYSQSVAVVVGEYYVLKKVYRSIRDEMFIFYLSISLIQSNSINALGGFSLLRFFSLSLSRHDGEKSNFPLSNGCVCTFIVHVSLQIRCCVSSMSVYVYAECV